MPPSDRQAVPRPSGEVGVALQVGGEPMARRGIAGAAPPSPMSRDGGQPLEAGSGGEPLRRNGRAADSLPPVRPRSAERAPVESVAPQPAPLGLAREMTREEVRTTAEPVVPAVRSAPRPVESAPSVALHPAAERRAAAQPGPAASEPRPPLPRRDLLSPGVDVAVESAFKSLGDLVLPQQNRTVEDLVKEILRPMLKEWLDQNLGGIVERLVRAEIERVTAKLR